MARIGWEYYDWWDDRQAALVSVLGPTDGQVSMAVIPFGFGFDQGGASDVLSFPHHVAGVVHTTCNLIGCNEQIPNALGNFELAICHREGDQWGIDTISKLAY